MSSPPSIIIVQKHTESRFRKWSPKLSKMKFLGRENVLDVLSSYVGKRIAHDNNNVLAKIYGGLDTKVLVQIIKELLLLTLDDGLCQLVGSNTQEEVYKILQRRVLLKTIDRQAYEILQCHVLLGLMEKEKDFDLLADHVADALIAGRVETKAMFTTQRRFESLRPLLQVMHEVHQGTHIEESIRYPAREYLITKTAKKDGTSSLPCQ